MEIISKPPFFLPQKTGLWIENLPAPELILHFNWALKGTKGKCLCQCHLRKPCDLQCLLGDLKLGKGGRGGGVFFPSSAFTEELRGFALADSAAAKHMTVAWSSWTSAEAWQYDASKSKKKTIGGQVRQEEEAQSCQKTIHPACENSRNRGSFSAGMIWRRGCESSHFRLLSG